MEWLVIVDDAFDLSELAKKLPHGPVTLHLFFLTSHFLIIEGIQRELARLPHVSITLLPSAHLINCQVERLQQELPVWSARLGNLLVGTKTLKEWLLLPDKSGSAWWFGLLSEKNSVQENVFFKVAQVNAILQQSAALHYAHYVLAISDIKIEQVLFKALQLKSTQISRIKILPAVCRRTWPAKLKHKLLCLMDQNILGNLLAVTVQLILGLRQGMLARRYLRLKSSRLKSTHPFMFITYFPNVDEKAARDGTFRNLHGLAMQEKLAELNIPVTWLLMPVFYNGHDFQSAMQLASTFAKQGETIFVLQEFFTFKIFFKSIYWWLRQAILSAWLYTRIDKHIFTDQLTNHAALPLVQYMWRHSLIGTSSIRGIIFYLTYLEMFKTLAPVKICLHYCEMQAWEKALQLAKKQLQLTTQIWAFQHTVVVKNAFNYFYHPQDVLPTGSLTDMPLPDLLLANGLLMYRLLAQSQFPNLKQVEAIRHLYLYQTDSQFLQKRMQESNAFDRAVLLVVGSADRLETRSLITLVYATFPLAKDFEIWFKGSPVNPLMPLFAELDIDVAKTHYKIVTHPIAELLTQVKVALVGNTTVAIEARAVGCHVLVPLFADTLLMNPIVDTDAPYFLVSSPQALAKNLTMLLLSQPDFHCTFIKDYWHLDPQLPLWTSLLNETLFNHAAI